MKVMYLETTDSEGRVSYQKIDSKFQFGMNLKEICSGRDCISFYRICYRFEESDGKVGKYQGFSEKILVGTLMSAKDLEKKFSDQPWFKKSYFQRKCNEGCVAFLVNVNWGKSAMIAIDETRERNVNYIVAPSSEL